MHLAARTPPPPDYKARQRFWLLSHRRIQCAVYDLRCCLADVLLIICRCVAFVASSLLVHCKFSASCLLFLFFRGFLQVRCKCSALCLVCGAFGEHQNRCQKSIKIVQNEIWKGQISAKNHENDTRSASGGVSDAGLFRNTFWSRVLISTFDVLAPFGQFTMPFWAPFDSFLFGIHFKQGTDAQHLLSNPSHISEISTFPGT